MTLKTLIIKADDITASTVASDVSHYTASPRHRPTLSQNTRSTDWINWKFYEVCGHLKWFSPVKSQYALSQCQRVPPYIRFEGVVELCRRLWLVVAVRQRDKRKGSITIVVVHDELLHCDCMAYGQVARRPKVNQSVHDTQQEHNYTTGWTAWFSAK